MATLPGGLPEFPEVPNGDPLLAAPVVINDREVSTLINLDKTRFSGGYKKAIFRDPLDPRNGYKFGFRGTQNFNPNSQLFSKTHEQKVVQTRSYNNSLGVNNKPTNTQISVKPITEKKQTSNQSSIQTNSKVLNDVFFLNYQKKRSEPNVKQTIHLIPQKKIYGEVLGTKKNQFGFYEKPQLSNKEFKQIYHKISDVFGLPLITPKGKIINLSVDDVKNTQAKLKQEGKNDKLTSEIKYDFGFVDLMPDVKAPEKAPEEAPAEEVPAVEALKQEASALKTPEFQSKEEIEQHIEQLISEKEHEIDISAHGLERDNEYSKLNELEKDVRDIGDDIDKQRKVVDKLYTDIQDLKDLNDPSKDKEIKDLEEKSVQETLKFTQLEKKYNDKNDEAYKVERIIEELNQLINDAKETVKEQLTKQKEKLMKKFNKTTDRAQKQYDGYKLEYDQIDRDYNLKVEENLKLISEYDGIKREIKKVESQEKTDESTARLEEFHNKKNKLKTQKQQTGQAIKALQERGNLVSQKILKLEQQLPKAQPEPEAHPEPEAQPINTDEEETKEADETVSLEDIFTRSKRDFSNKKNISQLYKEILIENKYPENITEYVINNKIYGTTTTYYGDIEDKFKASKTKNTYEQYKKTLSDQLIEKYPLAKMSAEVEKQKTTILESQKKASALQFEAEEKTRKEAEEKQQKEDALIQRQTDIIAQYEGNKATDGALLKLNKFLSNEKTYDDIVGALVRTIRKGSKEVNAKISDSIQRLLLLKIATEIEKDDAIINTYFNEVLNKPDLGANYQRGGFTLHNSLHGSKAPTIKTALEDYIVSIKERVKTDLNPPSPKKPSTVSPKKKIPAPK